MPSSKYCCILLLLHVMREDGDYGSMSVPWHLKGFCVHNAVVSMCIAPANHKPLSLSERCELSLAGFISLDLFKILADQLCSERGLPKGTLYFANQTLENLQSTALNTVLLACTKPSHWSPWQHGFCRVSELPIEQYFGHLRVQSQNAQLSSRSYWLASARTAFKTGRELNQKGKTVPVKKPEPCLTEKQPLGFAMGCVKESVKEVCPLSVVCCFNVWFWWFFESFWSCCCMVLYAW